MACADVWGIIIRFCNTLQCDGIRHGSDTRNATNSIRGLYACDTVSICSPKRITSWVWRSACDPDLVRPGSQGRSRRLLLRIRREISAPRGATVAFPSSCRRRACSKRRLGSASTSSLCAGSRDVDGRPPAFARACFAGHDEVACGAPGNDSVVSPRALSSCLRRAAAW
jgi:hypothetical protein